MCRAETNVFRTKKSEALLKVKDLIIIERMTTIEEDKTKKNYDICQLLLENHSCCLAQRNTMEALVFNLDHLDKVGVNTEKLRKQLDSYNSRFK
jgi:hypothetical protein